MSTDTGPRVGSLTIVFRDGITADQARHLVDEIAGDAIGYESVDAVKCDVAEFDQGDIDAFWNAALGSDNQ